MMIRGELKHCDKTENKELQNQICKNFDMHDAVSLVTKGAKFNQFQPVDRDP